MRFVVMAYLTLGSDGFGSLSGACLGRIIVGQGEEGKGQLSGLSRHVLGDIIPAL